MSTRTLAPAMAVAVALAGCQTPGSPGVDLYTVACDSGDALSVRCELSACRVLR